MNTNRNRDADLNKLAQAFYDALQIDLVEYGGIGLDGNRPFRSLDVNADILEIIEWGMEGDDGEDPCYASYQLNYAYDLYHTHLIPYLRLQWSNASNYQAMRAAVDEFEGKV